MRFLLALAGLLSVAVVPSAQGFVGYDTFGPMDRAERIAVFNEATPENRAHLVRTHSTRWLEAHLDDLTPEQAATAVRLIDLIETDLYIEANAEEQERMMAEAEAALAVLSREQLAEGFTINGAYVPR